MENASTKHSAQPITVSAECQLHQYPSECHPCSRDLGLGTRRSRITWVWLLMGIRLLRDTDGLQALMGGIAPLARGRQMPGNVLSSVAPGRPNCRQSRLLHPGRMALPPPGVGITRAGGLRAGSRRLRSANAACHTSSEFPEPSPKPIVRQQSVCVLCLIRTDAKPECFQYWMLPAFSGDHHGRRELAKASDSPPLPDRRGPPPPSPRANIHPTTQWPAQPDPNRRYLGTGSVPRRPPECAAGGVFMTTSEGWSP
jgi:hypothetical protein